MDKEIECDEEKDRNGHKDGKTGRREIRVIAKYRGKN